MKIINPKSDVTTYWKGNLPISRLNQQTFYEIIENSLLPHNNLWLDLL